MPQRPYTPTRMCPHAWCRTAHLAFGPIVVFCFIIILASSVISWLELGLGALCVPVVIYMATGRSYRAFLHVGLAHSRDRVMVRAKWARTAIGMDIALLVVWYAALVALVAVTFSTPPDAQVAAPLSIPEFFAIFGPALAVVGFWIFAHWRAGVLTAREDPEAPSETCHWREGA